MAQKDNQNFGNQNYQHKDEGFHDPNKEHEKRYPFDEGKRNMRENLVDVDANLIYQEKHWQPLSELRPDLVDSFQEGDSPLTRMKEGQVCEGVLHIKGNVFEKHKEEIIGAIRHSDEMARERDPLNRVMKIIRVNENEIVLFTTKNQLSVTIGKKLDSAFKGGELDIQWSKDDKEVEVRWHLDKE